MGVCKVLTNIEERKEAKQINMKTLLYRGIERQVSSLGISAVSCIVIFSAHHSRV